MVYKDKENKNDLQDANYRYSYSENQGKKNRSIMEVYKEIRHRYLDTSDKIKAAIRMMGPYKKWTFASLSAIVGYIIGLGQIPLGFQWFDIILLFILFGPILQGICIRYVNDIGDLPTDIENVKEIDLYKSTRSIAHGFLSIKETLIIAMIGHILALSISFYLLGWMGIAIISFFLLCSFLYSFPPVKLKSKFLMGNVLIGMNYMSLAFLFGWLLFGSLTNAPWGLIIFLGVYALFITVIKDMCDIKGDRASGLKTFPIVIGYLRSVKIYMILVIIPYILLSIFLITGFMEIYYAPLWVFGILNFIFSYKLYKYPTEKNAVSILDNMIMPVNIIQTLTVLILWYLFH